MPVPVSLRSRFPLLLQCDASDTTVPLNQARRLRDALLAADVELDYREIAGLAHVPPNETQNAAARAWIAARLADGGTIDAPFADGFEP
jgi:predicted esterase